MNPDEKYPPLEPYQHVENGREADLKFSELLPAGVRTEDITPTIGSEVTGIQLRTLSDAGKAQLAALTAQRKVLVFRNQDFADLPIEDALNYGKYFGRLRVSRLRFEQNMKILASNFGFLSQSRFIQRVEHRKDILKFI